MVQYVKGPYEELKNHVTWSTLTGSQRKMVAVVISSILFSLVIWGVGSSFEWTIVEYLKFMQ